MARAYVAIGSNIDPQRQVSRCLDELRAAFGALTVSTVYANPAVGFDGEAFLNLVVGLDTTLEVGALAAALRAIEVRHGRAPDAAKFRSRTLDLDLLLYDDLILDGDPVELPRGDITRYAFVLAPLAEIAGSLRHPQLGRTYAELWAAFDQGDRNLRAVDLAAAAAPAPAQHDDETPP